MLPSQWVGTFQREAAELGFHLPKRFEAPARAVGSDGSDLASSRAVYAIRQAVRTPWPGRAGGRTAACHCCRGHILLHQL